MNGTRILNTSLVILGLLALSHSGRAKSHPPFQIHRTGTAAGAGQEVVQDHQADFSQALLMLDLFRDLSAGTLRPEKVEAILEAKGTGLIIAQQTWRWAMEHTELLAERIGSLDDLDAYGRAKDMAESYLPKPIESSPQIFFVMGGRASFAAVANSIYMDVLIMTFSRAYRDRPPVTDAEVIEYFAHEMHDVGFHEVVEPLHRELSLNEKEERALQFLEGLVAEGSVTYLVNGQRNIESMRHSPSYARYFEKGDTPLYIAEEVLRGVPTGEIETDDDYGRVNTIRPGHGYHVTGSMMFHVIDRAGGMESTMKVISDDLATQASVMGVGQESDPLPRIRELRLQGALAEAQVLAQRELGVARQDPRREFELRIELARIHDRIGLHQNTRPVAAALEQIEAAASIADDVGPSALAEIELAWAEYYYRAEIPGREFPRASGHAHRAIELFRDLGDRHGEADAVHRLGLIHLQRGDLEIARELFDRSLELDQAAGEREIFRGDYERHVGYTYLLDENTAASIPHFEWSLDTRRQAGAVDRSLFAASTLASALVDLGQLEEARPHLLYAMMVAERLDSPVGKSRTGLVLGRLYQQEGDGQAARIAFEMTLELAESIGYSSIARLARTALEDLSLQPDDAKE